jgi:hypothetical protein
MFEGYTEPALADSFELRDSRTEYTDDEIRAFLAV